MVCNIKIKSTGEDSKVYKELYGYYGEGAADNVYKHINSEQFKTKFGNWEVFYHYDYITKNRLRPNHKTKKEANAHAESLNKEFGDATAYVRKGENTEKPYEVVVNKPLDKDVSYAVNEQGEPRMFYAQKVDDEGKVVYSSHSNLGPFIKPDDLSSDWPVHKDGELAPVFLNVKEIGEDSDMKVTEVGGAIVIEITPYSAEQVIPVLKGVSTTQQEDGEIPEQSETTDAEIEAAKKAHQDEEAEKELKESILKRRKVVQKAMGVLKKKKAMYERKDGKSGGTVKGLNKQLNTMERLLIKNQNTEALLSFLDYAYKQSEKAVNTNIPAIKEVFNDPKSTEIEKKDALRKLAKSADYLSAFEVVEEVYKELENEEIDSILWEEFSTVDRQFSEIVIGAIKNRINSAKRDYLDAAKEISASFLMEHNTDPNLKKEDITRMLTQVSEDISWGRTQLSALADSPDQVLALVDRAVSYQRAKINYDMETFKQTRLKKAVEEMEKYQRSKGIGVRDYEKLYDFMLLRDKDGKLTGKYLEPNSKKGKELAKPLHDFLVLFDKEYKAAQKLLPSGYRRQNQLIPILKSGAERAFQDAKGIKSTVKAAKQYAKEQVIVQVDDADYEVFVDESGKEHKFIPIKYTARLGKSKNAISPENISLDIAGNLTTFMTMAKNHSAMLSIITELEATKDLLGEREVSVKRGGKTLYDKVKYGREKKELKMSGKESNSYKRMMEYLDMVVYGHYKKDEGDLLGVEGLSAAKTTDLLMRYTSVSQLAFNLFSGINNASIGKIMNQIEGAGGQFYTRKDYRRAQKEYIKNLPGIMKDSVARFSSNPLNMWMEAYDIFQEFDEFHNPIPSAMTSGRVAGKATYFIQNAGEHMIQSELTLAMQMSHRLVDGKIMSFQDWILENNLPGTKEDRKTFESKYTNIKDIIDIKDGKVWTKEKVSQDEMIKFAERIKGVYQRLHGNYAKKDSPAIQKHALGRLAMLFRKWLKPGWDRRFAKETFDDRETFDQRLGAQIAGNYAITWNFLKNVWSEYRATGFALAIINKEKNGWNNLPAYKQQAIKRTMAEVAWITAAMVVISLLGEAEDDEDWFTNMGIYQAHRLKSELFFYSNPMEALKILQSPSASISSVEKIMKAGYYLTAPIFDLSFEWEEYERGDRKGDTKLSKAAGDLVPFYNQIRKAMTPEESAKFFNRLW